MNMYEFKIKRMFVGEAHEDYKIKGENEAAAYLKEIELHEFPEERFYVLYLDTRNEVTGFQEITKGLMDRSHVHPREVFRGAILNSTSKIIVAHNHPTGDTSPSIQDINVTNNLIEAGEILGIKIVDHIIVGESKGQYNFRSMRAYNDVKFK